MKKLTFRVAGKADGEAWSRHSTLALACKEQLRWLRSGSVPNKVQQLVGADWVDVASQAKPELLMSRDHQVINNVDHGTQTVTTTYFTGIRHIYQDISAHGAGPEYRGN